MKTLALICMLIDHIGLVFFPYDLRWRVIGRLAMPIFAYCLARGLIYTSSIERYIKRLVIFALISQIPFWLLEWAANGGKLITLHLNIGFTFVIAAIIVYLWQRMQLDKRHNSIKKIIMGIMSIVALLMADFLNMDYGSFGVLVVIGCYMSFRLGKNELVMGFIYTFLVMLLYSSSLNMIILQEIGVIGFGICYMTKTISEKSLGKLFYIVYPMHMLIIGLVSIWYKGV